MREEILQVMYPVWILTYVLMLCRVAAAVFVFPALGTEGTPRMVKVGLSVALAAICFLGHGFKQSDHVQSLASDHRKCPLDSRTSRIRGAANCLLASPLPIRAGARRRHRRVVWRE